MKKMLLLLATRSNDDKGFFQMGLFIYKTNFMKRIEFFFAFLSLFFSLQAQEIGGFDPNTKMPLRLNAILDHTKWCVCYLQTAREDSMATDNYTKSEMILQVGDKLSKYTNYTYLQSDSILKSTAVNNEVFLSEFNSYIKRTKGAGERMSVIKNYPTGMCSVEELASAERYFYSEETPDFQWKIVADEAIKILNYKCLKATCNFRGRDYIAWFAPEIQASNGPWKFSGLPGLILKVEDTKGDFSFVCTALYPVGWEMPITRIISKSELKVTREKFLQIKKRDMDNPLVALQNSGKFTYSPERIAKSQPRPYNPIEKY